MKNRSGIQRASFHILFLLSLLSLAACSDRKPGDEKIGAVDTWPDSIVMMSGDRIVAETFDTLRKSLLTAVQRQGFAQAIDFCSEKASALTSLYGDTVMVRRTSLRYRNPGNKPDSLETQVLETWEREVNVGHKPVTSVFRDEGRIHYFKPITMQALCVNCHGSPGQDIQPSTLTAIRKQYPEDKAIGFKEGDLRGSWHLIFPEHADRSK